MLDLEKRRRQRQSPKRLPEGVYDSVVTEVRWADGYDDPHEAYEVIYEITDESGNTYRHREIFKNNASSDRTNKFEDYLTDNGVQNLNDFVGRREKLAFSYVKVNGNEFFNITDREFADVG